MTASRRPQTATYNDGPGRVESVRHAANPIRSMNRSASNAVSICRVLSRHHDSSRYSSISAGAAGRGRLMRQVTANLWDFMRRVHYGWYIVLVASAAMVGTLPGRTQGLGLITEPLLVDLRIDRVSYAELNFWATILGSAGAIGIGQLIDRVGGRAAATVVPLALGVVV